MHCVWNTWPQGIHFRIVQKHVARHASFSNKVRIPIFFFLVSHHFCTNTFRPPLRCDGIQSTNCKLDTRSSVSRRPRNDTRAVPPYHLKWYIFFKDIELWFFLLQWNLFLKCTLKKICTLENLKFPPCPPSGLP